MIKLNLAADTGVQTAAAASAAAGGLVTGWTAAKEVAFELFGVPLPVVLACATAAYGALSFVAGMSYVRTALAGAAWTAMGTYGAQLALSLIGTWAGIEIPSGALAGAGMVVAGGGPLVVTRENVQKLRAAVGRVIDGLGKGGQS
jgi:hypothetical protein